MALVEWRRCHCAGIRHLTHACMLRIHAMQCNALHVWQRTPVHAMHVFALASSRLVVNHPSSALRSQSDRHPNLSSATTRLLQTHFSIHPGSLRSTHVSSPRQRLQQEQRNVGQSVEILAEVLRTGVLIAANACSVALQSVPCVCELMFALTCCCTTPDLLPLDTFLILVAAIRNAMDSVACRLFSLPRDLCV